MADDIFHRVLNVSVGECRILHTSLSKIKLINLFLQSINFVILIYD